MNHIIGILGGMGPLATVDFLRKLVEETPAACDQDHLPVIAYSVPQIPDRTHAIIGDGTSPLPMLLQGAHVLRAAGATLIAMPCNTAHYWHADLAEALDIPLLHIADCVCDELARTSPPGRRIGLLATQGTLRAGFYREKLAAGDFELIAPTAESQSRLVMRGIQHVKQGRVRSGGELLAQAVAELERAGAARIVLACTEIPVALAAIDHPGENIVDATQCLARGCIRRASGHIAAHRKSG